MDRAIRPVGYVAGWGFVDGMDGTFGWDRDGTISHPVVVKRIKAKIQQYTVA
jgi:hypothetical protein